MGRLQTKKTRSPDSPQTAQEDYNLFELIDGTHPWKQAAPEGFIEYPVRELRQGDIAYFNFNLAKEMGLIPKNHPNKMNARLKKKILKTFSIRIINEFDQENNIKYHPRLIKEHKFMATRYLQLQHSNKQGKTSGDGRCIWNGTISHKGVTWDISSRGTGVTALAPGSVNASKPLETGNVDFGYGCGLAEMDELYSSSIMSEIFHFKGISTERMLAVIDLGDGYGIGVRAGLNLLRPAHLFLYLKQNRLEELKQTTDYLIDRQCNNGEWNFKPRSPKRYDQMLRELSLSYSHFLAMLDREYIFMWLDWDGDNVLANGGIIDYGSIRQLGLRHDQYRYDDVERLSTNLNEQYSKGRLIFQVFIQLVDYIKSGKKQPLKTFESHPLLDVFDKGFQQEMFKITLYHAGFDSNQISILLDKNSEQVAEFYQAVLNVEKVKTHKKSRRVDDGYNRPALFDIKLAYKALPDHFLSDPENLNPLNHHEFFGIIISNEAQGKDRKVRPSLSQKFIHIQECFIRLVEFVATPPNKIKTTLKQISKRVHEIHHRPTLTGNGLIFVVDEIMAAKRTGATHQQIQNSIDFVISEQTGDSKNSQKPLLGPQFLELINAHKDSI